MRLIPLGKTGLQVPSIAVGCMRMSRLTPAEAETFVHTALDMGANFFDHADIYGGGACEEIFAQAVHMSPAVREKMILQSKCGIIPGVSFDFSREHILRSVDGILRRLHTEYLDMLLLHRPDALMEPEEVAEAFDELEKCGKVRHFGVSNQNPMQIQLLQKYVRQPLHVNQLQLSIPTAHMIASALHTNMQDDTAINRDGYVLDFCRLHDITIQPWSPFQQGFFGGPFIGSDKYPYLNEVLERIGKIYGVSSTCIAMAWLLRHPAKMQPVTGTMNPGRLADCVKATDIRLTREEWYAIYLAAGYTLP